MCNKVKVEKIFPAKIQAGEKTGFVITGKNFDKDKKKDKVKKIITEEKGQGENKKMVDKVVEIDEIEVKKPGVIFDIHGIDNTKIETNFKDVSRLETSEVEIPPETDSKTYKVYVINPNGDEDEIEIEIENPDEDGDEGKIRCKKCGKPMDKPTEDDWFSYLCPDCGHHQKAKVYKKEM